MTLPGMAFGVVAYGIASDGIICHRGDGWQGPNLNLVLNRNR
jgi:hypothetical protein